MEYLPTTIDKLLHHIYQLEQSLETGENLEDYLEDFEEYWAHELINTMGQAVRELSTNKESEAA